MPPTVLLADDDRALRKLIRAYLAEVGLAVHEAADGEEALQLARRLVARPDRARREHAALRRLRGAAAARRRRRRP